MRPPTCGLFSPNEQWALFDSNKYLAYTTILTHQYYNWYSRTMYSWIIDARHNIITVHANPKKVVLGFKHDKSRGTVGDSIRMFETMNSKITPLLLLNSNGLNKLPKILTCWLESCTQCHLDTESPQRPGPSFFAIVRLQLILGAMSAFSASFKLTASLLQEYDIDNSLWGKSRTQMEEQAAKMTKRRRKQTKRTRAEWARRRRKLERRASETMSSDILLKPSLRPYILNWLLNW